MNIKALLSIGAQIKTKCPDIKNIDIYNNQYMPNMEGVLLPMTKPAVLIEFGTTNWTDESNGVQEGEGLVRIHIVLEKYKSTFKLFDKTDVEKNAMLAHYLIPKTVHAALQDFTADGTLGPLDRVNSIPDHDFDNLIVEVFEYQFRDQDDSAYSLSDYVEAVITDITATGSIDNVPG